MKKLTVKIRGLQGCHDNYLSGTSVTFKVFQSGSVLVEDTLSGKASLPYQKVYRVSEGVGEVIVAHNRPTLDWLSITANFD
ncbi:hypothetical protein [Yokenella regensburgei]|uniref:hypothetical protein n=1 Tax=Yokenella regensburgei TaxID=158877 RepID=UPI002899CB06|nr:hypothetical protein [Yokenella regensburgei]